MIMSKYVLAFRGQPDRSAQAGEEEQWGAWFAGLGPAIADFGSRVGATRTLASEQDSDPGTRVLTGYIVVSADSLEAASQLAAGCPGLRHDVSVEVAEVVDA
jgi:hypothetical protein